MSKLLDRQIIDAEEQEYHYALRLFKKLVAENVFILNAFVIVENKSFLTDLGAGKGIDDCIGDIEMQLINNINIDKVLVRLEKERRNRLIHINKS